MNRSRQVGYALVALCIGLVAAMALSVPIITAQIRATQVENTKKSDERDETLALMQDCVQPTGECFKRGQRRTAKAVGEIGAGNILAVVCALQVPNGTPFDAALDQVSQCVADRLARPPKKP